MVKPKYTDGDVENAKVAHDWGSFADSKKIYEDGFVKHNNRTFDLRKDGKLDPRIVDLQEYAQNLEQSLGNKKQTIFERIMIKANKKESLGHGGIITYYEEYDEYVKAKEKFTKDPDNLELKELAEKERKEFLENWGNRESKTTSMADFTGSELSCYERSVALAYVLHEAGIETILVCGTVTDGDDVVSGGHAFLVSKATGRVLEVTSNRGQGDHYYKVLNPEADITKGETLVVKNAKGELRCYGTGKYDVEKYPLLATTAEIERAIAEYDQDLMAQYSPEYRAQRIAKAEKAEAEARKSVASGDLEAIIENYSFDKDRRAFIPNDGGREITERGRGNGKGFHFGTVSLVERPDGKLTVWKKDSVKFEVTSYDQFEEAKTVAKQEEKPKEKSGKKVIRTVEDIAENYIYDSKKDAFIHKDGGREITERGKGNGKGFHFGEISLVKRPDGKLSVWKKGAKKAELTDYDEFEKSDAEEKKEHASVDEKMQKILEGSDVKLDGVEKADEAARIPASQIANINSPSQSQLS